MYLEKHIQRKGLSFSTYLQEMRNWQDRLSKLPVFTDRKTIMSYEGHGSKQYFRAISASLPTAYKFRKRSRRPGKDLFNVGLNYAMGIMYKEVETSLLKAGLDPYISFAHGDTENKPAFTFDFIEPYRPWVVFVVTRICQKKKLVWEHVEKRGKGYWLNKGGKQVIIEDLNQYLHQIVVKKRLKRSRKVHLYLEAKALTQFLLDFNFTKR